MSFLLLLLALFAPAQDAPQPFTKDQIISLSRSMKDLAEPELVAMVEKRGIDFTLTENAEKDLRKAGAGNALIAAVKKASDDRKKTLSPAPAPESAPAVAAAPDPGKGIVAPPPLDSKGQIELIEKARQLSLDFTKGLPSFLCDQVTKRYVSRTGREDNLSLRDNILAKLSYNGETHSENYRVLTVNNQMTDKSMMALGGSISTGEFGSMLLSLFDPEREASFQWERQAGLRGRATEVYTFKVRKDRSNWHIEAVEEKRSTYPAYTGRVWVDRETGYVLRLLMNTADMEPDFPIRSVQSQLDYNWSAISGIRFLLPESSVSWMNDGHYLSKNMIEFRMYRKFEAESKITFDTDDKPETPPKKP